MSLSLTSGNDQISALASEYKVEEFLVAATVSITTLLSVATLLGWLYALSRLSVQAN